MSTCYHNPYGIMLVVTSLSLGSAQSFGQTPEKAPDKSTTTPTVAVKAVVSQLSYSTIKYSGTIEEEQYYKGVSQSLAKLLPDQKGRKVELSSRLILANHGDAESTDDSDKKLATGISEWLLSGSDGNGNEGLQLLVDDLDPISADTKPDEGLLNKYYRRIKIASLLKCNYVVVNVNQYTDPKGEPVVAGMIAKLLSKILESEKSSMSLLIEPKRGRSLGIQAIKSIIRLVHAESKYKNRVGICLNLSSIPDDSGELWADELFGYVHVVSIETFRFNELNGTKEASRDYKKIIDRVLAKIVKNESRPPRKTPSEEDQVGPNLKPEVSPFTGYVVLRYYGRESLDIGIMSSIDILGKKTSDK